MKTNTQIKAAKLQPNTLKHLLEMEQTLRQETNEEIVLVAYVNQHPSSHLHDQENQTV